MCAARAGSIPSRLREAYLAGGARVLQLRAKGDRAPILCDWPIRSSVVRAPLGAVLIINDRADIARLSGAAGSTSGRTISGPAVRSCCPGRRPSSGCPPTTASDRRRACAARRPTSPSVRSSATSTKETGYSARGLDLVAHAAGRGKPIVAIGGITIDNVSDVVRRRGTGIAVITDLLTGTIRRAARENSCAALTRRP